MRVLAAAAAGAAVASALLVLLLPSSADGFVPPSQSFFASLSDSRYHQRQHDDGSASALGMINIQFPWQQKEAGAAPAAVSNDYDEKIESSLEILKRAADTKDEDPELVLGALEDLEKLMRTKCKAEPECASDILSNLNGSWRLVFTTGTKQTQDRIQAKINYFPIKAVQSFDTTTDPYGIENGIYLGDFAALKFGGYFDFDLVKRKLEFDFTSVSILGFEITIKSTDAAKIGASTGLGSESNVVNADKGKRPFFNWISADGDIATARGGGGGLALWKRVPVTE